jgi:hypothetical protein
MRIPSPKVIANNNFVVATVRNGFAACYFLCTRTATISIFPLLFLPLTAYGSVANIPIYRDCLPFTAYRLPLTAYRLPLMVA